MSILSRPYQRPYKEQGKRTGFKQGLVCAEETAPPESGAVMTSDMKADTTKAKDLEQAKPQKPERQPALAKEAVAGKGWAKRSRADTLW